MKKSSWGFDIRDLDTNVRPQDDFYRYAAGGWLRANPIPAHESRWGTVNILRREVEQEIKSLLDELMKRRATKGSPEQMVGDFYRSGMDKARRTKLGAAPLKPYLDMIDGATTQETLQSCIATFHTLGLDVVWGVGVDQDLVKNDTHALFMGQSGIGLPDREYYLKDDKEFVRVRTAYLPHVVATLQQSGMSKRAAEDAATRIYEVEKRLARASMTKEDSRDIDKVNNPRTAAELATLAPHIDWPRYFKNIGLRMPKKMIVLQPEFMRAASAALVEVPLADWQLYLRWHLVSGMASLLSPAFEKQQFAFYGTVLMGAKKMQPEWRRALRMVNGAVGELLGKVYVQHHFTKDTKKKANQMIDDLFTAYTARLKQLDWMTSKTKSYALRKLRLMGRKVGYPDRWRSYAGLEIRPDDYVGNVLRTSLYEHKREMRKLAKKVDWKEWLMLPQTVNAYCNLQMNEIVFPAAIMQPPTFDPTADDAINYASMGSVIAHEITHSFDNQGCKFDERGRLKSWWTKADAQHFEKKTAVLVKQFNAYTVTDGVHLNGKLSLGENVADLAGVSIAYDAYQLHLKKTGRKDIDGFTPEQRFFLGFTIFERENLRPEFEKTAVLTNEHPPSQFRVNGPVSNLPEFYAAFGVKKGDKLWRAPKDRAKIW